MTPLQERFVKDSGIASAHADDGSAMEEALMHVVALATSIGEDQTTLSNREAPAVKLRLEREMFCLERIAISYGGTIRYYGLYPTWRYGGYDVQIPFDE